MTKLNDLGVVRIYPKRVKRHRLPGNVEPALIGFYPKKKRQEYKEYFGIYPLQAYHFGTHDLAQVIRDDCNPRTAALIIVHMTGERPSDETVQRQAEAVKATAEKNIPIFNTQRDASHSLTLELGKMLKTEEPVFASPYGNALTARDDKKRSVGNILWRGGCHTVIVLGQALGQCVDSTILGQWYHDEYLPGLLDLGIMVVTARNVLLPLDEVPSSYFNFELVKRPFAVATQPAMPTGQKPGALAAPTDAPVRFANKTVT